MGRTARLRSWRGVAFLVGSVCQPAAAGPVVVLGDRTIEAVVAPGGEVRGEIRLRNTGEDPVAVRAYPSGYLTTAEAGHQAVPWSEQPRSSAGWLDLPATVVVLPPESEGSVPYRVDVPDGAEWVGSYWTAVMLEDVEPEVITPESTEGIAIRQHSRVAVRLVTHVGDTGVRSVLFGDVTVRKEGDGFVLSADVENTGERALLITPKVELYDPRGHKAGAFESPPGHVLPGCSFRFPVVLTDVPAGDYTAVILADGGFDALFGARHPIRLE